MDWMWSMRVKEGRMMQGLWPKLVEGWSCPLLPWGRYEDERDGEVGGAGIKFSFRLVRFEMPAEVMFYETGVEWKGPNSK